MKLLLTMRKVPGVETYVMYSGNTKTKFRASEINKKWGVYYGNAFRGLYETRKEAFDHIKHLYLEKIANEIIK